MTKAFFTNPEARILLQLHQARARFNQRNDISPRQKVEINRILKEADSNLRVLQNKHKDSTKLLVNLEKNAEKYSQIRSNIDANILGLAGSLPGENNVDSIRAFFQSMSQNQLVDFMLISETLIDLIKRAMPLSTEIQNTLNLFDSDYENCIVYDRFSDLFELICDTIADIDEVFHPSNESDMDVPANSAARSVSVDSNSAESDSSDSDSSDDFDFVTSVEPEDNLEDKKEDYGLYAPYYEMKKEFNALAENYQQKFNSLTEISKLISKSLGREPSPHSSDDDEEVASADSSSENSASRESSKDNAEVQTLFFATRNSNRNKDSSNNQSQNGPRMQ